MTLMHVYCNKVTVNMVSVSLLVTHHWSLHVTGVQSETILMIRALLILINEKHIVSCINGVFGQK